jgi:hypothetical protein
MVPPWRTNIKPQSRKGRKEQHCSLRRLRFEYWECKKNQILEIVIYILCLQHRAHICQNRADVGHHRG